MKIFLFLLVLCVGFFANSQVMIPGEVAKRLENDKSFSGYAREMTGYLKIKQSQYASGSKQRTYYDKQEKFLARQLWQLEGRQDANGNITHYTQKTYNALRQFQLQRASAAQFASTNGDWSLVGPTVNTAGYNVSTTGIGRADRIAFHPTNANIVFVGTPSSGIFKTVNGGDNWFNLNSFIPSLGVSGLVISWANPDVIYALTGDGDSNLGDNGFVQGFDYIRPSIGVLKSTDGGVSWELTAPLGNEADFFVGYKLIQNPISPNTLLAATSKGIYKTSNGGASWLRVTAADRFYDIEWKPGSVTRIYAATANSFYISNDGGGSFQNRNSNLDIPIDSGSRIALAVTPANPNYVYLFAAFLDSNNNIINKGVYKSINSGDNMIQISALASLASLIPQYALTLAASPNNADIVIAGNINIYRSINNAAFTPSSSDIDADFPNYVHADVHDLAYNPLNNYLYVASDGGVYISTNNGATYTAKYTNFSATQFFHFDVSTLNTDVMIGGAQDNGGLYREGNFATFTKMAGGDGYDVQLYNGSNTQAYISVNTTLYKFDANASPPRTNINSVGGDGWFKTIAMSYSNSNIVFVSGEDIYRTLNGGANWSLVSTGRNGRWAMITCPSNGNRVYSAGGASFNDYPSDSDSAKKMMRSDNQGGSWFELQSKPGFPNTITKITGIAVSPSNSNQVWITMGGFRDGEKVYYSNNAGESWANLSGTLPNFPINCITIDDNLDAYIGTDAGVFFKSALMPDWQPFYNGMPQIPVTDMHIRNGIIYASTFGRGIWKSETHGACPRSLSFTGYVNGVKFYEAVLIDAANTLRGGTGTEFYLRAQTSVTLTVGFRADGSTGEKFRAWIGDCGSGGIQPLRAGESNEWLSNHVNNELNISEDSSKTIISYKMPFDGKASLLLLDKEEKLKEVLLNNQLLNAGNTTMKLEEKIDWPNRLLALIIDGKIAGIIKK
ncbi:MAG: WD40/YVTN/BNR-like repeat-containing protein [Chitinophagaceae bacterium]